MVYPPHRPYLPFEAVGKVYQYRAMPFGTQHSPIFFAHALAMVLTKIRKESDIRILNYVDDLLLLHQSKERLRKQTLIIMKILEAFDQLPRVDLELGEDGHKDDRPKKTGTTLLIKEIYQPNIETDPDQDKISSLVNRQAEFFKSPSKRSFSLPKIYGFNQNKSIEGQRMEREYDFTQGNPSRALLVVGSDSEELRDDTRSEDSRGSDGIRCIPERLGSDSGTSNRRYFSPTWRMKQGTEEMDKQQEGDGNHILRTIPLRISLQRSANQSDPHQVRQPYRSMRFSKTKSRGDSGSKSEENSQTMSTTENTNTDSTYSGNLKQDNRRTKQVEYQGRLFGKERNIHSPASSMGDNTNIGHVRNRGKKLVNRFLAIGEEEEGAEWLNAFSRPWKEEIFWIHPLIPKIGKALIAR
ncbi:MAG: hypothetical protein EZS28_042423, partial [Streblomastix strix]